MLLKMRDIFAGMDVERVLEVFPEWITNYPWGKDEWCERRLREMIEEEKEEEEEEEAMKEEGEEGVVRRRREQELDTAFLCERYWVYHAACVKAHAFVEDAEAQVTGQVLHVFLDDCGRVVRQERTASNDVSSYDGTWFEGNWKEGFVYPGDLGEACRVGGVRDFRTGELKRILH